jgi:hypothetical protein
MKHIIEIFQTISGRHCITTSLRHIFLYHGHEISEEMLFGLGSGLSFFYGEFKLAPYPFIGMRVKIGEFEENLAKCLNIKIQTHQTASARKAYRALGELIGQDIPVMIYVDMAFLKYFNLPDTAHFGGHSIVVFGIDEEEGIAYVSDRDGKNHKVTLNEDEIPADFHIVSLKELEDARGSTYKPFPPKNAWLTFDFTPIRLIDRHVITSAIRETAEKMLYPPIKNVGLKGIRFCSEKVLGWKDFDDEKLKWSAFNGFILINQIGGTGGGGFRKMYGNFLRESGKLLNSEELMGIGDEYFAVGEEWDRVADKFHHIFKTVERETLKPISASIRSLSDQEVDLMNRLKDFSEQNLS